MAENDSSSQGLERDLSRRSSLARGRTTRRASVPFEEPPNLRVLTTRLHRLYGLSRVDQDALERLPMQTGLVGERHSIVSAGSEIDRCAVVLSGMAFGYKLTGDGQRQIVSLHLTGELPDIQGLHSGSTDIGVTTMDRCWVGYVARDALLDLCSRLPNVATALWRETVCQAAINREWLLNVGKRDSRARLAHFLCEAALRQRAIGTASDDSFDAPFTQTVLADILGLSTVHISRMLQSLRGDGLIEWKGRRLDVLDWKRLQAAADFHPAYLTLPRS